MAALRDIARDFAAEIRDGIGWTIVYRTGRSWNALTIWSDINRIRRYVFEALAAEGGGGP